jgi:hypothetical protein
MKPLLALLVALPSTVAKSSYPRGYVRSNSTNLEVSTITQQMLDDTPDFYDWSDHLTPVKD